LTAQALVRVVRAAFPRLNHWLNDLPDPRLQEMCLYAAAHLVAFLAFPVNFFQMISWETGKPYRNAVW